MVKWARVTRNSELGTISPFRFRHGISEFFCRINPQPDRFIDLFQSKFLGNTVSHTARQFRHFGHEGLILIDYTFEFQIKIS